MLPAPARTVFYPLEMAERLETGLSAAGVDHVCGIYPGALHGWTMADFPSTTRQRPSAIGARSSIRWMTCSIENPAPEAHARSVPVSMIWLRRAPVRPAAC